MGEFHTPKKDTMDTHSHPEIIQMQVQMKALEAKVDHHEKILVTGSDEHLSLPEVVRNLTNSVNTYIKRKEKEEEEKKEEWGKWKWAILTVVIPATLLFMGQAVIFYFRFVPIMVELANSH